MNEQLLLLVLMQDLHLEILKARKECDDIPTRIHTLEAKVRELEAAYSAHVAEVEQNETLRRQKERHVSEYQQKLKENLAKQYNVKTNKEFEAITAENTLLTDGIRNAENEILQLMERSDTLKKAAQEEKTQMDAEAATIEGDKRRLLATKETVEAEAANLQNRASDIEKQLPANYVSLFHRIAQRRGGLAVAECIEGICQGCQMKNRLQVWNDIAENRRVQQCFSCQRIVYKATDTLEEARRNRMAGL